MTAKTTMGCWASGVLEVHDHKCGPADDNTHCRGNYRHLTFCKAVFCVQAEASADDVLLNVAAQFLR